MTFDTKAVPFVDLYAMLLTFCKLQHLTVNATEYLDAGLALYSLLIFIGKQGATDGRITFSPQEIARDSDVQKFLDQYIAADFIQLLGAKISLLTLGFVENKEGIYYFQTQLARFMKACGVIRPSDDFKRHIKQAIKVRKRK